MSNPIETQLNYLRKLGRNNTCRQIILPAGLTRNSDFGFVDHVVITPISKTSLNIQTLQAWLQNHPQKEPHK